MACYKLFDAEMEIIMEMRRDRMSGSVPGDEKAINCMIEKEITAHMEEFEKRAFSKCMDKASIRCRKCFAGHMGLSE